MKNITTRPLRKAQKKQPDVTVVIMIIIKNTLSKTRFCWFLLEGVVC